MLVVDLTTGDDEQSGALVHWTRFLRASVRAPGAGLVLVGSRADKLVKGKAAALLEGHMLRLRDLAKACRMPFRICEEPLALDCRKVSATAELRTWLAHHREALLQHPLKAPRLVVALQGYVSSLKHRRIVSFAEFAGQFVRPSACGVKVLRCDWCACSFHPHFHPTLRSRRSHARDCCVGEGRPGHVNAARLH